MLGGHYRKPIGRKFGLDSSHGWSMKAPLLGEEVEDRDIFEAAPQKMSDGATEVGANGESAVAVLGTEMEFNDINNAIRLPDLNADAGCEGVVIDFMALIPLPKVVSH